MTRTLLGLWAHPDDEAYLSAGLMYRFVRRNDRVVVVTATRGELGSMGREVSSPAQLAQRRSAELAASLAAVGVHDHRILDYQDGACADADGTSDFVDVITDVDPDIIVTFGPDGITGHPDHRAVSAWATRAHAATRSRAQLWYATLTADFHREWREVNDLVGLFSDQTQPPSVDWPDVVHTVRLSSAELDVKVNALRAHESQTRGLIELVGPDRFRNWWRTETFRAASTPLPGC